MNEMGCEWEGLGDEGFVGWGRRDAKREEEDRIHSALIRIHTAFTHIDECE